MNKIMTATQVRKNFFKTIEEAAQYGQSLTVTLDGLPKVVMMSAEEWEGWQETMEVMADQDLMEQIRISDKELAEGKGEKWEDIRDEVLADD